MIRPASQVHIGTSGWHYKHWLGDFYPSRYPPAKMFAWYALEFHTVEINNSFYRLPEQGTFEQWKKLAPQGFIFAVKASRFITHIKKLKQVEDAVQLLLSRLKPLGSSLGPVLFQLPPQSKANFERLREFLAILPRRHQYVLEFRDPSWSRPEVYQLLRQHHVALCIHDWRQMVWPVECTAGFTYLRFHGSGSRYAGNYPDDVLGKWAELIQSWRSQLEQVFIYFNNDIGGHAVRNARTLRQMLGLESVGAMRLPQAG